MVHSAPFFFISRFVLVSGWVEGRTNMLAYQVYLVAQPTPRSAPVVVCYEPADLGQSCRGLPASRSSPQAVLQKPPSQEVQPWTLLTISAGPLSTPRGRPQPSGLTTRYLSHSHSSWDGDIHQKKIKIQICNTMEKGGGLGQARVLQLFKNLRVESNQLF